MSAEYVDGVTPEIKVLLRVRSCLDQAIALMKREHTFLDMESAYKDILWRMRERIETRWFRQYEQHSTIEAINEEIFVLARIRQNGEVLGASFPQFSPAFLPIFVLLRGRLEILDTMEVEV